MEEGTAAAPSTGGMDSISRNAFFGLATRISTAVFTAAVTLFLVRALGPAEYGLFALAMSAGALLLVPADLGISASAARFIAERRDRLPAVTAVLADALRIRAVTAGTVAVLLGGLAGPIASAYGQPGLAWPLRFIALALAGQTVMLLGAGTLAALGRQSIYFRVAISESVVETTAIVGLVLLGGGAAATAAGRAVGFVSGGALALIAVGRLLGRPGLPRKIRGPSAGYSRRLLTYASALFLLDGAFTAFAQVDVLLIGAYLSSTQVGLFEAPLRLTAFLQYPGLAVADAIGPRLASGPDGAPSAEPLERALRMVLLVQAVLSVPLVVWAEPIVELTLGSKYGGSVDVMRALAAYAFLGGVGAVVAISANYLGEARRRVPIAVATIAINLVIDIVLIPRIGIIAGAIGTGLAYGFYVPAHLWICHRVLHLDLPRLGLTLLRTVVAGAAMAGGLAAFGTSHLSPFGWIGGGLLGLAAYLAVLIVSRELSVRELQGVVGEVQSRLRTGG